MHLLFCICLLDPGALIIPIKGNRFFQKTAKLGNTSSSHLGISPSLEDQLVVSNKEGQHSKEEVAYLRKERLQHIAEQKRKDELLKMKASDGKQINFRLEILLKS